jgi:hypothetical protein
MISDQLSFLRGVPNQQAQLYNSYLTSSTQVRRDQLLPGDARLAQISRLVAAALTRLDGIQQQVNDAERIIDGRVSVPTADASDVALHKIEWAADHGLTLTDVCEQLVADNDVAGFTALRMMLPWLYKANKLGDYKMDTAQAVVLQAMQPLLTPAQRSAADEARECSISMPLIRKNFTDIGDFLQQQTMPSAVAGAFTRLQSLYRWQGLPNDNQPKGSLALSDDFGGSLTDKMVVSVNTPTLEEAVANHQKAVAQFAAGVR